MTPRSRVSWFLLFLTVTATAFRLPLAVLIKLSLSDERYSYVSLIPVVTLGLLLLRRRTIFVGPQYCRALGIPVMALGTMLVLKNPNLSATVCGIVLIWIAGFVLIFGLHAVIVASFPLGLLLLMIPIPVPVLDHFVSALQYSSAYMSGLLFRVLRVPAFRQGLIISLPGFDIEIAEQCSGIRSSIALTLASSLAGYVFLQGALNRAFLTFITVPVVIFKNAVRIVSLSSLALYVNQGFLFGRLHRYGGLCFSLLDLAIVIPLILRLHKSEASHPAELSTPTLRSST
jgi:exosortase